jgi:hypothetical protein
LEANGGCEEEDEGFACMDCETCTKAHKKFHPDLLWAAKNYPKIKTAGGKWVGWGKKSKVAHGLGS